ncbi:Tyrosine-protein phosphatase non-receptor type 9 [Toxocara canis]|uniref:Tyrosine-protein phosphatase non-receptor type 9 n=1 Tax=Toxocara canis TaxID=6265 RepID=A0A0B2W0E3_TOXCA|nr:Tyrosine-protein phosphatase non-receptor type 9 [Toxocara canis]
MKKSLSDKEEVNFEVKDGKDESKRKNKRKDSSENKHKDKKHHKRAFIHFKHSKRDESEGVKHKPKVKKPSNAKPENNELKDFTEEAINEKETTLQDYFKKNEKSQQVVNKWVQVTLDKGIEGLKKDFEQVKCLNPDPCEMSVFQANQVTGRNRFKDIPCLDETRVRLNDSLNDYIHASYVKMALMEKRIICTQDIPCLDETRVRLNDSLNDYIHASYVKMALMEKRIICTQAPLDLTVYHFYQMIMQERVTYIIMLCNFIESGHKVCTEYYPLTEKDAPLVFGDITVICLHEGVMSTEKNVHFTLLGLKNNAGKRQVVKHLRWIDWPENGIPDVSLTPMHIFSTIRNSKGPVVVHCTDGVSRTGALVAIEYILEKMLCANANDDSVQMIKEIRKQRALSVRTEMQYIYVHREILQYLQERQMIGGSPRLLQFAHEYDRLFNKNMQRTQPTVSMKTTASDKPKCSPGDVNLKTT